jgi:hypothetical protein
MNAPLVSKPTAQADTTAPRHLFDRILAAVTLADLSAPVALGVIAALTVLSWVAAYFLGGGTNVAPHWFYIPVFLAGLRFGPLGDRGHLDVRGWATPAR